MPEPRARKCRERLVVPSYDGKSLGMPRIGVGFRSSTPAQPIPQQAGPVGGHTEIPPRLSGRLSYWRLRAWWLRVSHVKSSSDPNRPPFGSMTTTSALQPGGQASPMWQRVSRRARKLCKKAESFERRICCWRPELICRSGHQRAIRF